VGSILLPKTGTIGGLLLTGLQHLRRGILGLGEQLLALQERVCSMERVSEFAS
jgi:hypothetical protein